MLSARLSSPANVSGVRAGSSRGAGNQALSILAALGPSSPTSPCPFVSAPLPHPPFLRSPFRFSRRTSIGSQGRSDRDERGEKERRKRGIGGEVEEQAAKSGVGRAPEPIGARRSAKRCRPRGIPVEYLKSPAYQASTSRPSTYSKWPSRLTKTKPYWRAQEAIQRSFSGMGRPLFLSLALMRP